MDNEFSRLVTPVGRLVMGSVHKGFDKDREGRPLMTRAGEPRVDHFAAIAISKTDPGWPAFHATMKKAAHTFFPSIVGPDGIARAKFSWKLIDGDSTEPNEAGKIPNTREGFPGCYVLSMSSGFSSPVYRDGGKTLIRETDYVKLGHYIRAVVSFDSNRSTSRPGIYVNHHLFEFIAYGPEIQVGIDGGAILSAAPAPVLPAGASVTPIAPPAAPAAAAVPPPPAAAAVAVPPPPAAPDYNFVYDLGGQSYTKQQLLDSGWTEDQIVNLTDRIPF